MNPPPGSKQHVAMTSLGTTLALGMGPTAFSGSQNSMVDDQALLLAQVEAITARYGNAELGPAPSYQMLCFF